MNFLYKIKVFLEKHVRTIPWVIISICIFLMLMMSFLTLSKIESQTQRLQELVHQQKELSEQNKELLEKTIYLADRNIYYTKCITHLFATYTQKQQPVTIENIYTCEVKFNGNGTKQLQTGGIPPQANKEPAKKPDHTPQPNPQECDINILGIKILCS